MAKETKKTTVKPKQVKAKETKKAAPKAFKGHCADCAYE